jgi:hypothetical protein
LAIRTMVRSSLPRQTTIPTSGRLYQCALSAMSLPAQVLAFWAGRGVVAAELEARSRNDAEPLQELAHPPAAEGMGR